MANLSIKPRWWIERQVPVEITGYKLPFGIQAEAAYQGIRYRGVLYPVAEVSQADAPQEQRVLTLRCRDRHIDQTPHTVTVVREDEFAWYTDKGRQYPKFAWKEE